MCKKCYECLVNRTNKIMLFCSLKENEKNELERLCSCQRFCSDEDKYIPHRQKEGCKYYE